LPVDKATMQLLAKQDLRIQDLEKQLAEMRLDLKSAGILHDEAYIPPPADELTARTGKPEKPSTKKSKVEVDSDKLDLFS